MDLSDKCQFGRRNDCTPIEMPAIPIRNMSSTVLKSVTVSEPLALDRTMVSAPVPPVIVSAPAPPVSTSFQARPLSI